MSHSGKTEFKTATQNREDRGGDSKRNNRYENRGDRDGDSKRNNRYERNVTYEKKDQPKREPLIIPPIPEDMSYDYFLDGESDDDNDFYTYTPLYATSFATDNTDDSKKVVGGGLKYDSELNKYFDGIKLKLPSSKTLPMNIARIDAEGYVYLYPVTDDSMKVVMNIKNDINIIHNKEDALSSEAVRLCDFDALIKGEIVVAKIVCTKNDVYYVRAKVTDISLEAKEATVVDIDTLKEYHVPKERLYRAYQVIMRHPVQVVKFRLQKLFENTEIAQQLCELSHWYHNQPAGGFFCSWEHDEPGDIPVVKISRYGYDHWNFGEHLISLLGAIMGAKCHLTSGLHNARICNMTESGDIWLQFPEQDKSLIEKTRFLLNEIRPQYEEYLKSESLKSKIHESNVFIVKISRSNLCRVVIHEDFSSVQTKYANREQERLKVECIDFGTLVDVSTSDMVPIEYFSPIFIQIPAWCQRVRYTGIKSFPINIIDDTALDFKVEICAEWPNDVRPLEVKMTFSRKGIKGSNQSLEESLAKHPETKYYSASEKALLDEERRRLWEKNENESHMNFKEDESSIRAMPDFIAIQYKLSKMNPFERLKGPYNGSHSGLSATPWLDISVDGNNEEWTRREHPLPLKSTPTLLSSNLFK